MILITIEIDNDWDFLTMGAKSGVVSLAYLFPPFLNFCISIVYWDQNGCHFAGKLSKWFLLNVNFNQNLFKWVQLTTRTTRRPAFWGYPPPPHDYPYHWVILDPMSKEDKVKVTNFKNSLKFQSGHDSVHRRTDGRTRWNQYTPLQLRGSRGYNKWPLGQEMVWHLTGGMPLTLNHQEMHGYVLSTVTADALVLKYQVISIHSAD